LKDQIILAKTREQSRNAVRADKSVDFDANPRLTVKIAT
jgi:hypothetical protein